MRKAILHYILSSTARINRLVSAQGFQNEPKGFRHYLLGIIHLNGGVCSFQNIVRNMPIDKGTVSRQLLALERDGYVCRRLAEGSARRKCAALTPLGESYSNNVLSMLLQAEKTQRRRLKSMDYRHLYAYLERMYKNLLPSEAAYVAVPEGDWPALTMRLFHCGTNIFRLMNTIRTQTGLLIPEQRIIMGLGGFGDWSEYKRFEAHFVISQQEVAKTFTNLACRGIVELRTKENDRRAREARLLPCGVEMHEQLNKAHHAWEQQAFKQLNEKSQTEFLRLLKNFCEGVDAAYGKK